MVAFTHLCEKVNISLFNNTLTLYPNTHVVTFADEDYTVEYDEVNDVLNELYKTDPSIKGVKRQDADHPLYHQIDKFDQELTHFHVKFAEPIDRNKLEQILEVSLKHQLVSDIEKENIIKVYDIVSQNLTIKPEQLPPTQETKPEIKPEIKVETQPKISESPSESPPFDFKLGELERRISKLRVKSNDEVNFLTGLRTIVNKVLELEKKQVSGKESDEYKTGKNMCNTLFQAFVEAKNNKIEPQQFKETCGSAIASARGVLDRAWKQELADAFSKIIHAVFSLSDRKQDIGFFKRKEMVDAIDNVKTATEEFKFQPK